ncbi:MAG: CRISPR associated protein Cas10d, large subunit of Type I-D system effector complex [Candidatus Methanohalarchaeum thermophilum]|uniref:CRISPR associated protein Cas10d, large subunit of Type I-D system effector complex n=1 Tax=Methanohalarchaeum thermophilum TaxID=1903181 RepID=A0A1Q6DWQ5_METT1|nr:MAG: CRISPR associated protein Cas10d, large subunit of Type I-D system effector complex [Candidatus Methanohalarchaeum thermophilum]
MAELMQYIEDLRKKALNNNWHLIRGKGTNSQNELDLLSHSLDVVQITYNLASELDLKVEYSLKDFITAAFFHDLHKIDNIGGTETMSEEEVKSLLDKWGVKDKALGNFSLQEFTDLLKSIHSYHGSSSSKIRVNSNKDLFRVLQVIRLSDGIASTENLDSLYQTGNRKKTRQVERLNQFLDQDYCLGYHQLSEVKPALGALIHQMTRKTLKERGSIPVGSRIDATIYLLPRELDTKDLKSEIANNIVSEFKEKSIVSGVPDKIRSSVYGAEINIETLIQNKIEDLNAEKGQDNLDDQYRNLTSKLFEVEDLKEYSIVNEGSDLVDIDKENESVLTSVPVTQKGYLVGDTFKKLTKELNSQENIPRIKVIEGLSKKVFDVNVDLDRFQDINWRTQQTHLAMIVGNYCYQKTEFDAVKKILKKLGNAGKNLLGEDKGSALKLDYLSEYLDEILTINWYKNEEEENITGSSIPNEIKSDLNYDEACILCGKESDFDYRTSGRGEYSEYSASYMTRGVTGKDLSSDWKLCTTCFLDNALMRSLISRSNSISDMENTLFLKVMPNRYLNTSQIKLLRANLNESFNNVKKDSEKYLATEKEYEIENDSDTLYPIIENDSDNPYYPFQEDYQINLDKVMNIENISLLISSENYFFLAIEDKTNNETKQITLNWLKAIQRALLLYRMHNVNVRIESNPEMLVDKPYPDVSGVKIVNPPSQISSVFDEEIKYKNIDGYLDGLTNLTYVLNFDQYSSIPDLNGIYGEFKRSMFPGARFYRAGEREANSSAPYYRIRDNVIPVCDSINYWKSKILLKEDLSQEKEVLNVNRIENVVKEFKISASPDASTHEIQLPLRKMINKILDSDNKTKEEIIEEAAGSIYRRVERKWGESNVYISTEENEGQDQRIEKGCKSFYEEIYEDMLNEDKIRLANQKNDILDAFYFNVQKKGDKNE